MLKPLAAFLISLLLPLASGPAVAACAGSDLLAALTSEERAGLDAAVAAVPFATGNHWRAVRGEQTIHLIGTLHLSDPRMTAIAGRLTPLIAQAGRVYLEATDTEIEALQQAIARQPDLIFTTGPTLPERLSREEWAVLSDAMRLRGIPPFLASKLPVGPSCPAALRHVGHGRRRGRPGPPGDRGGACRRSADAGA